jgi:hypothetical protein
MLCCQSPRATEPPPLTSASMCFITLNRFGQKQRRWRMGFIYGSSVGGCFEMFLRYLNSIIGLSERLGRTFELALGANTHDSKSGRKKYRACDSAKAHAPGSMCRRTSRCCLPFALVPLHLPRARRWRRHAGSGGGMPRKEQLLQPTWSCWMRRFCTE